MRLKAVIGIFIMISLIVLGNLLMKTGATSPASEKFLFGLFGWRSLSAMVLFAAALPVYAWLLKWIPLNVAQSFLAGQFLAVVLASAVILAEPISATRWVGIALIAIGIAWVGFT